MGLVLTVLRCPDAVAPETRRVAGGEYRIGRDAARADWVLRDPGSHLSRQHCVVRFDGANWQVEDTSSNGTFLNRDAAPIGNGAIRPLRSGDRLRLGPYEIEITVEAPASTGVFGAAAPYTPPPPGGASLFGESSPGSHDMFGSESISLSPKLLEDDFADLIPASPPPAQPDHTPAFTDSFRPPTSQPALENDWEAEFAELLGTPKPAPVAPPAPPVAFTPPPTPAFAPPPGPAFAPAPAPSFPPPQEPAFAPPPAQAFTPAPAQPITPPPAPAFAPAPAFSPPPAAPPAAADPFGADFDSLATGFSRSAPPPVQPAFPPTPPDPFAEAADIAPPPAPAAPVAPPAAVPQAAPAPPAQQAAPAAADAELLAAFMTGVGLPELTPQDPVTAMRNVGAAFRAFVAGLREALMVRAEVKSAMRIDQTFIRARGNNPLKFSAGDDDALTALLGTGRRTDMTPQAAVAEALRDLRHHEQATMPATQTALRAMLEQLNPELFRTAAEAGGIALPAQRRARAFDAFEAAYAKLQRDLADDFDTVFGRNFAEAYEAMVEDLRRAERNN